MGQKLGMGTEDEEIKLNFLVSGSYDALPSSYLKLRSYLNIHSSNLAHLHGLKLPKWFLKKTLVCDLCFLPWSHDSCSIKFLPNQKQSKDLIKNKGSSYKNHDSKLSKTHLVLKCNVCMSRSHFYLPKLTKKVEAFTKQCEGKFERKKKKKKKDKTCGLHKVLTACKKPEIPKSSPNRIRRTTSEGNKPTTSTANLTVSFRNPPQTNSKVKNRNSIAQPSSKIIPQPKKNKKVSPKTSRCTKLGNKSSRKKNQSLQKLRKIVQGQKEPVKKTLKDFLTLI